MVESVLGRVVAMVVVGVVGGMVAILLVRAEAKSRRDTTETALNTATTSTRDQDSAGSYQDSGGQGDVLQLETSGDGDTALRNVDVQLYRASSQLDPHQNVASGKANQLKQEGSLLDALLSVINKRRSLSMEDQTKSTRHRREAGEGHEDSISVREVIREVGEDIEASKSVRGMITKTGEENGDSKSVREVISKKVSLEKEDIKKHRHRRETEEVNQDRKTNIEVVSNIFVVPKDEEVKFARYKRRDHIEKQAINKDHEILGNSRGTERHKRAILIMDKQDPNTNLEVVGSLGGVQKEGEAIFSRHKRKVNKINRHLLTSMNAVDMEETNVMNHPVRKKRREMQRNGESTQRKRQTRRKERQNTYSDLESRSKRNSDAGNDQKDFQRSREIRIKESTGEGGDPTTNLPNIKGYADGGGTAGNRLELFTKHRIRHHNNKHHHRHYDQMETTVNTPITEIEADIPDNFREMTRKEVVDEGIVGKRNATRKNTVDEGIIGVSNDGAELTTVPAVAIGVNRAIAVNLTVHHPSQDQSIGEEAHPSDLHTALLLAVPLALLLTLLLLLGGWLCCCCCCRRRSRHGGHLGTGEGDDDEEEEEGEDGEGRMEGCLPFGCEACLPDISYQVHKNNSHSRFKSLSTQSKCKQNGRPFFPTKSPTGYQIHSPRLCELLSNLPPGASRIGFEDKRALVEQAEDGRSLESDAAFEDEVPYGMGRRARSLESLVV